MQNAERAVELQSCDPQRSTHLCPGHPVALKVVAVQRRLQLSQLALQLGFARRRAGNLHMRHSSDAARSDTQHHQHSHRQMGAKAL
jgi:hypothetical protein